MSRIFRKGKGTAVSSLLNILGLTVAFAALYIILVQVHHDLSYNKGIKDSDRIYVVSRASGNQEGYTVWCNRPLMEALMISVPGIEAGGCIYLTGQDVEVFKGDGISVKMSAKESALSKGAREVFGFELVRGSWDGMTNQLTYALSESASKRLGLDVGDSFLLRECNDRTSTGEKYSCSVAAVYKDMPGNTDFDNIDMFADIGQQNINDWSEISYNYFVKSVPGINGEELDRQAALFVENTFKTGGWPGARFDNDKEIEEAVREIDLHFIPLPDVYFEKMTSSPGASGNKTTTITLLAVAILVMMIALINFINFFFALVPVRIKSVNTKKILGSSRSSLIIGTVVESVGMIFISVVFAAVLVYLFQTSAYADLISTSVAFGHNVGVAIVAVLLALAIGIAASVYPAFYITSFNPAFVIKGSFGASLKGKTLRYSLIGLQFVISIALIICAIFINMQRRYMMSRNMGFERENLIVAQVSRTVAEALETATDKMLENPQIKDVTWANGNLVADSRMGWGRTIHGTNFFWECYPVAWNFLSFMGIEITEGRDFTPSDEESENGVFIFNESARKEFDLSLEDHVAGHRGETEIAGFCKDFNFRPLQNKIEPFSFYVFGKYPWKKNNTLFVRTVENADLREVFRHIRNVITEIDPSFDQEDIDVRLFDDKLQSNYTVEENLSKLITLFTFLAIIISLMGVFGLVMFETEYRRKEIGIRRVSGATVTDILAMFNTRFVKIVIVCFVIAAPLSWWIVNRYLEGFAYRVPVYFWVFCTALLAVLAVTVAVVTLRSLHAATSNPVESLRTE